MELNKIYNEDCLLTMEKMTNGFVDLILTSPPYDNLRKYSGEPKWDFNIFMGVANKMRKILSDNGVLVWIVGDAIISGCETGTSFRQALYFMDIGFRLHDTMIYEKNSSSFPAKRTGNRYTQIFEYMFVFCNGKPNTNLLCDKENKWAGYSSFDGKIKNVPEYSPRTNIWKYSTSFNDKTGHPAVFPEQLANDHILSWSKEGDIVYDPFMGSGTTAKMALINRILFIGSEISEEYCISANNRISKYL